eukprot:GHVQ01026399.1.p1 GENE.GHVQ01026399.1~~GHVQ01026399.1.p1  ORF type:complete len:100 (-),score=9.93 GHVQ01026399.1:31-330(-)
MFDIVGDRRFVDDWEFPVLLDNLMSSDPAPSVQLQFAHHCMPMLGSAVILSWNHHKVYVVSRYWLEDSFSKHKRLSEARYTSIDFYSFYPHLVAEAMVS